MEAPLCIAIGIIFIILVSGESGQYRSSFCFIITILILLLIYRMFAAKQEHHQHHSHNNNTSIESNNPYSHLI
jgi:hypothetical protein